MALSLYLVLFGFQNTDSAQLCGSKVILFWNCGKA